MQSPGVELPRPLPFSPSYKRALDHQWGISNSVVPKATHQPQTTKTPIWRSSKPPPSSSPCSLPWPLPLPNVSLYYQSSDSDKLLQICINCLPSQLEPCWSRPTTPSTFAPVRSWKRNDFQWLPFELQINLIKCIKCVSLMGSFKLIRNNNELAQSASQNYSFV